MLFGCEDPFSPAVVEAPESGAFEAGPSPEGAPPSVDASVTEAAAEAAAPVSVVVHVTRAGVPAANVMVVFHDAAGSVLETKTTGADGRATSTPGQAPSQATALLGGSGLRRLLTWTAVELGDELIAEDLGPAASAGAYAVTLQGDFSDGGATRASASVGACSAKAAGTSVSIPLDPDCARPSVSVLATAFDTSDAPIAYAFAKAQSGPVDAGTATASVGPWLTPAAVSLTTTNAPAQTTFSAGLIEVSGGLGFTNASGSGFSGGGETFGVAPGFADAYQAEVRMTPNLVLGATLLVAKRVAPAASTALDLSTALPALNGASVDATDVRRPVTAWTTTGGASLAATDGGSIALRWFDAATDDRAWVFVVPPGATSVKAPVMPVAADAWLPISAGDGGAASSFGAPEVTFVESDLLPGYPELRRDVGRIVPLVPTTGRAARAWLPANGTLRATSFLEISL